MTWLTPPPRALKRAQLDNLALVPASLLPYRDEYQAIANQQPPGTTLVVLPTGDSLPRRTLELVASQMQQQGRSVKTIPALSFSLSHQ
jgi:hypothetical protein